MITKEFLEELEQRRNADSGNSIRFTDEEVASLTAEDADGIIVYFRGQAMMYMPASEKEFFEWMKQNDPQAWLEMWGDGTEPYTVSISSLRSFIGEARGFLVCDLDGENNYFFHKDFIIDVEKERLLAELLHKVREKEELKIEDVFILEIWIRPTDIWHFAYKYGYPLADAKEMIGRLVDQGILRHPKKRDEIAAFVE